MDGGPTLEFVEHLISSGEYVRARELLNKYGSLRSSSEDGDLFRLKFLKAKLNAALGDYSGAIEDAERLLEYARSSKNEAWKAKCHILLSGLYLRVGEYSKAELHSQAAIYLSIWELQDASLEGDGWNNLGLVHKNLGCWHDAEEDFRKAIAAYAQSDGAQLPLVRAKLNLSILLRKKGRIDEAHRLCEEGRRVCGECDFPLWESRYLLELGNIAVIRGDLEEARRYLNEAHSVVEAKGYRREKVLIKELSGDIACAAGDYGAAAELYRAGLSEACGLAPGGDLEYELLIRLARAYLGMGRLDEGLEAVKRAVMLASACGDAYEHAIGLRVLGELEIACGKVGCGIDYLRESLRKFAELSLWSHELARTELVLGKALLGFGDKRIEALEHLLSSRRIYSQLGVEGVVREIDELIFGLVKTRRVGGIEQIVRGSSGSSCNSELLQYGIVTCDERIVRDVLRWGGSELRVLIEGETGVGKELIARAMHAMSRRCERRFMVIDCAGLSESLAESELFGHSRGSFTGAIRDRAGLIEEADGGTLFLDEVGELSERLQVKLLRVLEDGCVRRVGSNRGCRVDVRVISATTRDLWREVEAGRFRRDLYYRLKGVLVRVPSLRERPHDVELLLDWYLERYSEEYGVNVMLSNEARERLLEYSWPGNVRELKHVLEALVASVGDGVVGEADVVRFLESGSELVDGRMLDVRVLGLDHHRIERALKETGGNKTKAARLLGISRQTLWHRMKTLGMGSRSSESVPL